MKIWHHLFGAFMTILILGGLVVGYNTVMKYKPQQTVVSSAKEDKEQPDEKVTIIITEPETAPSLPTPVVPVVPEKNWKVREFLGECVLENTKESIIMTESGDIVLKIEDYKFKSFPRNIMGTKIGFYNSDGTLIAKITTSFGLSFTNRADGERVNATVTIKNSRQRIEMFKNLSYIEVEGQKFSLEGSLEGWNDLQKCLTNK